MASFTTSGGSVSFQADGKTFNESRDARVTIQDIPGGDTFYADLAGRGQLRWQTSILLEDNGAWGTLNAILGRQGTLSIETFDGHSAVLTKVGRPTPFASGETLAPVEFLIVDS